jgi:AraC-like DNA-binding protein
MLRGAMPRRVVIVALAPVQPLDVTGPAEVLATAAEVADVEALRLERARIALESSTAPIEAVARRCGFGTVETLRRAFARRLGVSPAAYRSRFAA